jgi:hypothetical protein
MNSNGSAIMPAKKGMKNVALPKKLRIGSLENSPSARMIRKRKSIETMLLTETAAMIRSTVVTNFVRGSHLCTGEVRLAYLSTSIAFLRDLSRPPPPSKILKPSHTMSIQRFYRSIESRKGE